MFKPMLAPSKGVPKEQWGSLKFPMIGSPKLDGIRCLIIHGKAVTRSLKPIPNDYIRGQLEKAFAGSTRIYDGELTIPGADYSTTQGDVMRKAGEPEFLYSVFDCFMPDAPDATYWERQGCLGLAISMIDHKGIQTLEWSTIHSPIHLEQYEHLMVGNGYEGVMLRDPEGPYKFGRCTVKQGWLLKIKRWHDDEGTITGVNEEMANENEATKDALGRTERSTHKANLKGKGRLGSLVVAYGGVSFDLGSGYTAAQREALWASREALVGQRVTFKFQELHASGIPRFPIFKGIRSPLDA